MLEHFSNPEYLHVLLHPLPVFGLAVGVAGRQGTCSRGRAAECGSALGGGAELAGRTRTGRGAFQLAEATTSDELAALTEGARDLLLKPADGILGQLARIDLEAAVQARFCQGQAIALSAIPAGVCRGYGSDGHFLGIAEERPAGWLAPKRLLAGRKYEGSQTGGK